MMLQGVRTDLRSVKAGVRLFDLRCAEVWKVPRSLLPHSSRIRIDNVTLTDSQRSTPWVHGAHQHARHSVQNTYRSSFDSLKP